jgi:hypothetical protein
VDYALTMGMIYKTEDEVDCFCPKRDVADGRHKIFNLPVTSGKNARTSLEGICRWATQRLEQRWIEFEADNEMKTIFGLSPLAGCKRLPSIWRTRLGLRNIGRVPLRDKLGKDVISHIGRRMKDLQKEARACPATDNPDWEVQFNTFNSIVREINVQRQLAAEPPIAGDCSDGRFSESWIRVFCLSIGLGCVTMYSHEGKN